MRSGFVIAFAVGVIASAAAVAGRAQTGGGADEAPDGCIWTPARTAGAPAALSCVTAEGSVAALKIPPGFGPQSMAAARAGDPKAMTLLGQFYLFSVPPQRDVAEGRNWIEKAAAAGLPLAMRDLGLLYVNGELWAKDLPQALIWLNRAAAAGDAPAMTALGRLYETGAGVPRDDEIAARWYHKAERLGDTNAMMVLGHMISQRRGLPVDRSDAVRWVKLPSPDEMTLVFPIKAAVEGVNGEAVFSCRLDAERVPRNCRLLTEQPAGYGFGAAGLSLVDRFRASDLRPVGDTMVVPIRFQADMGDPPRSLADQCAAYAMALRRGQPLSPAADWQARYWVARSHWAAVGAGEGDPPGRLDAAVAADVTLIAEGKDKGMLGSGLKGRCAF